MAGIQSHSSIQTWDRSVANNRSKSVSRFIDFRWAISQFAHFSKHTFFQEHVGPITPFEMGALSLVLIIPIICAIIGSKISSGQVAEYMIFIAVLVALKNNALQFCLGISWERAILFHKVFSFCALICGAIHGIPQLTGMKGTEIMADNKTFSGLILLLLLGFQPILYALIKPYFFEVFYYLHLSIYGTMIYFAVQHGASFVLYSVILFVLDLAVRYTFSTRRVTVRAEYKGGDVVQLTFEKKLTHRAGQYVFLMIPALGVHEWHPFTVSSAPHEETLTLHISVLGNWTRRLAELAKPHGSIELTAFVEGPYGLPAINLESSTYPIVLLISGSIGVTPHQALANQLLHDCGNGRPLQKLIHIWALRDPKMGLVSTMIDNGQFPTNRSFELSAVQKSIDQEQEGAPEVILASPGVLYTELYCTRRLATDTTAVPTTLLAPSPHTIPTIPTTTALTTVIPIIDTPGEDFTNIQSNLEANCTEQCQDSDFADAVLRYGRPDFVEIFRRVRTTAVSMNVTRVAVSVCGPASMVESATTACRQCTSAEVQFDLHIEVFRL
mgnify:CR=1 FL=1